MKVEQSEERKTETRILEQLENTQNNLNRGNEKLSPGANLRVAER